MWKVGTVVFWTLSLILSFCFSLALGLNLVLMPLSLAIGLAVGTSARRLSSWTCPRCDAELLEPEPQTEFTAVPASAR